MFIISNYIIKSYLRHNQTIHDQKFTLQPTNKNIFDDRCQILVHFDISKHIFSPNFINNKPKRS